MLQLQVGDVGIIVLEPENVRAIQAGNPLRIPLEYFKSPKTVCIDFTNDAMWLAEQCHQLISSGGDPRKIIDLITESAKRPEPPLRGDHPPLNFGAKKANA